ncbi:MAG: hypothetical protein GMKNLPBB_00858 [Myxococcota bacterium]|nr:hypothetical protein [Myxococcota bacterium]
MVRGFSRDGVHSTSCPGCNDAAGAISARRFRGAFPPPFRRRDISDPGRARRILFLALTLLCFPFACRAQGSPLPSAATPAGASAPAPDETSITGSLANGLQCYRELEFDCAIRELEKVRRALPSDRQRALALGGVPALRHLALSHAALGNNPLAVQTFKELLKLDPDYQLDDSSISPRIKSLLDKARRESRSIAPAPGPIQPVPAGITAFPRWAARLHGGAILLAGDDQDRYTPGMAVDLGAGYRPWKDWEFSLNIGYQKPDQKPRGDLNMLDISACAGWTFAADRFRLALAAGPGFTFFGINDLGQASAFFFRGEARPGVVLGGGFRLSLLLRPALSAASGKASYTTVIGAGAEWEGP